MGEICAYDFSVEIVLGGCGTHQDKRTTPSLEGQTPALPLFPGSGLGGSSQHQGISAAPRYFVTAFSPCVPTAASENSAEINQEGL